MKLNYKGYELEAKKERSMGGEYRVYYFIIRISDRFVEIEGSMCGEEYIRTVIVYLKRHIDKIRTAT